MIEMNGSSETSGRGTPPVEAGRGAASSRRKTYAPPRLIEWGTLTELTRGGSGLDIDYDFVTTKAV